MIAEFLTYHALLAQISLTRGLDNFSVVVERCEAGQSFFGLPTWYKYLKGNQEAGQCTPILNSLGDLWLIVLAIVEILLRIAAIAAVAYVVFGGFKFISARGNAEKITNARNTVQDALIGLVIAVAAIAIVNFLGSRL